MVNENFGKILQPNVEYFRKQFSELTSLIGTFVEYSFPLSNKEYTTQGEIMGAYSEPIKVGCIFEENITQQTAKKLGWISELSEKAALISVPYDLENLQIGCRFLVPSAFDNTPGRLFRVSKMSSIQAYPASITCEIVPEYESDMEAVETEMFVNTNFNLLEEHE